MLEFIMSVVNPEMYKEYIRQKNSTVQVRSYKEDMSEEDFMRMTQQAHENFSPDKLKDAKKRSAEMKGHETAQPSAPDTHPQFNLSDPSTWQRPPGVPPMRQVGVDQPPDDEDDINPITITKRE